MRRDSAIEIERCSVREVGGEEEVVVVRKRGAEEEVGNLMLVVPHSSPASLHQRGMIMVAGPRNPRVMDHDL